MSKISLPPLEPTSVFLYPTDTIWGIGADATVARNYSRIKAIKNRPEQMNFVLLMRDIRMVEDYTSQLDAKLKECIQNTTEPTTFLVPNMDLIPLDCKPINSHLTAVRISSHPVCQSIMTYLNKPIISTSANIHKQEPAKYHTELNPLIIDQVDYVIGKELDHLGTKQASSIIELNANNHIVRHR